MKLATIITTVTSGLMLCAAPIFAQENREVEGQAIVTILSGNSSASPQSLTQNMTLKVGGKETRITGLEPLQGEQSPVELAVVIDGSARSSLGRELDDIAHFVRSLPPNVRVAVGYMQYGTVSFKSPFSVDHATAVQSLHLPSGPAGSNGSPYLCLSDLAQHWPSQDRAARREVVMITDGVDEYNVRFDPQDPYVQASINDATRAHLVVYSIYWRNQGRFDRSGYADNDGQNLLQLVTQATGGKNFWIGLGNPVSFEPYLDELAKRMQNQYELSFTVPLKGKAEVEEMKLKLKLPGSQLDAPQQIFIAPAAVAQE